MALINNIYVLVQDEKIDRSTQIPQHPVEKGLPLTDSIRNEPKGLSISGKIVNTEKSTASKAISEIEKLRTGGSLIKYVGINVVGNYMITSFNTSHPNTNWGGADFDMELVEVRIAKSAYDPTKQQQKKAETVKAPSLTVGSIVVFKGGAVYVSSDAKKAAANRGRQTCKITKISTKSWSVHQYHLISTEKQYPNNVYGWVDKSNIEGSGATSTTGAATTVTSAKTNGGTKATSTKTPANSATTNTTTNTTGWVKHTTTGEATAFYEGTLADNGLVEGRNGSYGMIVGTETAYNNSLVEVNGVLMYRTGKTYIQTCYATKKKNAAGQWDIYFPKNTRKYKEEKLTEIKKSTTKSNPKNTSTYNNTQSTLEKNRQKNNSRYAGSSIYQPTTSARTKTNGKPGKW